MNTLTFQNSRGLSLVGDLYEKDTDKVVIIVHGFTGDRHGHGLHDGMIDILKQKDYAVFAFDFSGCGESDDDTLTVDKQVDDLDSAIDFLFDLGYSEVALIGHSLGGLISFKVAEHRDIKTIIAWAPVTDKKPTWHKEKYSDEQLKEFQEQGYLLKRRPNNPIREEIRIDKQMIFDRVTLDQEELLTQIDCPVLIIQGTNDASIPMVHSKKAMDFLNEDSDIVEIEGADHGFETKRSVLYQETIEWLDEFF